MLRPIVLRQQGHARGGGRALAQALGIAHVHPNSRLRRSSRDLLVINWGVSNPPTFGPRGFFYSNSPQAVANCANKATTLYKLDAHAIDVLEWSQVNFGYNDILEEGEERQIGPKDWLEEDGKIVVRHILNGHSGAGIQIVRRGEEIPNAPLYTRYFKKSAEYRVHVAFGRVVLIQQKRKETGYVGDDNPNHELIRTHDNGWVFCVNGLDCDAYSYRNHIEELAVNAIRAVGANHGAVDLLVRHAGRGNTKTLDRAVACEINSAPAIRAESTLQAYVNAFRPWVYEHVRRFSRS